MKLKNPEFVGKVFPLAGASLFLWGYLSQIVRMWTEHTAAGQSLTGWIVLWLALVCYWHFYRVCCPKEQTAIWSIIAEIAVNVFTIFTVVWFRFLV